MSPIAAAMTDLLARSSPTPTLDNTRFYGYVPSENWGIAYVVLFSTTALVHVFQATRSRYWIIYPTLVLGACLEILGWAGRLWSSQNPGALTPFLMQICCLIMAPVFFSAYCYTLLGWAIAVLGPQFSLLQPRYYFLVFIAADLVSLILQAVGGGQAASNAGSAAPTLTATNIMVAGIIFQLISMGVFVILGADFIVRATIKLPYGFQVRRLELEQARAARGLKRQERTWYGKKRDDGAEANLDLEKHPAGRHDSADSATTRVNSPVGGAAPHVSAAKADPGTNAGSAADVPASETEPEMGAATEGRSAQRNVTKWWILLGAALFSSFMIVTRGVYRSIELIHGWDSHLNQTEVYQLWLDAFVMLLAVSVFNIIHPWYLFGRKPTWRGYH